MRVGDKMRCETRDERGRDTGAYGVVEVREIARDHESQQPVSVRVKFRKSSGQVKEAWIWVQARFLRPLRAR